MLERLSKYQFEYLLLPLLWLVAILLVNPIGDFPLNDSWSYGKAVQNLVEDGEFHLTKFTGMPLFTQVVWGGLWGEIFGFSFTVLRFSTLFLALVTQMAFFALLRTWGVDRKMALLGTLILGYNPLFFNLSFTFMTDIPFMACVVLSLLFFFRGLSHGKLWLRALAIGVAVLAVLERQLGLFLPMTFAIALMLHQGFRLRPLLEAALGIAVVAGAFFGYIEWLDAHQGLPFYLEESFNAPGHESFKAMQRHLVKWAWNAMDYLALFMLPALLLKAGALYRSIANKWVLMAVGAISLFWVGKSIAWLFRSGKFLPERVGNVWYDFGLGPLTTPDVYTDGMAHGLDGIGFLAPTISILSTIARMVLLTMVLFQLYQFVRTLLQRASVKEQAWKMAVLLGAGIYLFPICYRWYFVRYLLPLLVLALPFVLTFSPQKDWKSPWLGYVAAGILALGMVFSIGATRDYLNWNRSRWEAYDWLREEGVPRTSIDGGFEVNEWTRQNDPEIPNPDDQLFYIPSREHMITFNPVAGYEVLRVFPYQRTFPLGQDSILVLRAIPQP